VIIKAAVGGRGRKPAQPSIPEGILGFPPPDTGYTGHAGNQIYQIENKGHTFSSPSKKSYLPVKIPMWDSQVLSRQLRQRAILDRSALPC
jgi:hypothetical protein